MPVIKNERITMVQKWSRNLVIGLYENEAFPLIVILFETATSWREWARTSLYDSTYNTYVEMQCRSVIMVERRMII